MNRPASSLDDSGVHAGPASGGAQSGQFVINLSSSTTPMALVKPQSPELARFTFFVSRRREEGRERFRLHMGYFATRREANELLNIVREIYPAAWVGDAPGKKLAAARQAAAPAAAPAPSRAAAPNVVATPAPKAAPVVACVVGKNSPRTASVTPAAPAQAAVPAPAAAPSAPRKASPPATVARGAGAPVAAPVATPPRPAAVKPTTAARPSIAAPTTAPAAKPAPTTSAARAPAGAAPVRGQPAKPAVIPAAEPRSSQRRKKLPRNNVPPSNVREVLAQLGGAKPAVTSPPRAVPQPPAATRVASAKVPPTPTRVPAAKAAPPAAPAVVAPSAAPAAVVAPASPTARLAKPELSDTQVLKMLERQRSDSGDSATLRGAEAEANDIQLLRPDDTGTMRALRGQLENNAPVSFAVQLDWSVTPIDLAQVPPLAIFSAYTLYTVEGDRDGRKWFGLRLGFFSDAVSAKQVAHYVRSDFASVAVVPVGQGEKDRAAADSASAADKAQASRKPQVDTSASGEFKLFDVDQETSTAKPREPVQRMAPEQVRAKIDAVRNEKSKFKATAPGRRSKPAGAPQSLEETLEILGASELQIDNGRGELLNDSGVRHLRVQVDNRTRKFSKLLDRLADRLKS
ncbi:MAG: hypothetical protein R3E77_15375 [Steroidobacteraceae bacterium]